MPGGRASYRDTNAGDTDWGHAVAAEVQQESRGVLEIDVLEIELRIAFGTALCSCQ
ncbi:hypothetical protein PUN4_430086 [Paraburkholderia unamae]|nr:hypothetical protein PUN4_430086 [Paraburkholderia unamae]